MESQQSHSKSLLFIVGGILLLVLLFFGLEKLASQDEDLRTVSMESNIQDEKFLGKTDAPVTLIEYSDFQCPACAAYEPLVRDLHKDFPDTLKIVYRYFPLATIHKNAMISAKAAQAALNQGKFWEMHDMLFDKQKDWEKVENPQDIFIGYAEEIGLNKEQFKQDIEKIETIDPIKRDEQLGKDINIHGTPSFFLNGKKIENPQNYADFKKLVDDALATPSNPDSTKN